MSPRSFGALAACTAVALALAGWAVATRDVPAASRPVGGPLFAGLLDQLDEVAVIRVEGEGKKVTIKRDGEVWRVEERSGFPADPAKVREVARGLAGLQLVEAKTATPDRLARLQLEDPAAKDAKSRSVALDDAQGEPVAAAVLGKEKYDLYGGGRGGLYVRRGGENQAWLAAGRVSPPAEAIDWIDTKLTDIPANEIARVTLAANSSAPVVISKADRKAEQFTLDAVPEGRVADPEKLARVAGVLESLTMHDVQPVSAKPVPADAPKARLETWDGLVVTASVLAEGEGDNAASWVTLEASAAPAPLAPPAPAAAEDVEPAGEAPAAPAEDQAGTADAPKPISERVAELNDRLSGWSFKLPNWVAERLVYAREDLLADPAQPDAS